MVTIARMNPPMPPTTNMGAIACIASSGEGALKKRFHVHAAVATQQMSRMPVLLTAPEMVMLSPKVASPVRKVSPLKAGLEVLISWAMQNSPLSLPSSHQGLVASQNGRCTSRLYPLEHFQSRCIVYAAMTEPGSSVVWGDARKRLRNRLLQCLGGSGLERTQER